MKIIADQPAPSDGSFCVDGEVMKRTVRAEELVGMLERFERLELELLDVMQRAEQIARGRKSSVLGYRHLLKAVWLVGRRNALHRRAAGGPEVGNSP